MKKIYTLILITLITSYYVVAQDTLKVLQYNLLYYGLYNDYCTSSNNNVSEKTEYLKAIINYTQPDIFSVNEITDQDSYHSYLLDNVFTLNEGVEGNYTRASTEGDYLTSQIYYNEDKLTLLPEYYIYGYPRKVHTYKFYYNSPDLLEGDTAFFYCFVAHLKAGNDSDDAEDRANSTENVMDYIGGIGAGNYLFMGDLNLYTSEEVAFQNLLSPGNTNLKFNDPVNADGEWHNTEDYADYHTQSTFYSGSCGAGGGLDDRFDFILLSNNIMDNSDKIKYINGSYTTVGQDGEHFNSGLNYQGNSSGVPADVLDALSYNSDHLPILLELEIDQTPISVRELTTHEIDIKINNPVEDNLNLQILLNDLLIENYLNIQIYSVMGKLEYQNTLEIDNNTLNYQIPTSYLNSGLYILKVSTKKSLFYSEKFIKM